jgi:NADH dehydrogenase FAD-containing subunit
VLLITPDALTPYSGMMPGVIAGHYRHRQACIDLQPLAGRAACALKLDAAVSLDASNRCIQLASGETIGYDLLSIDTGSTPVVPDLPGAARHGHPVKPIVLCSNAGRPAAPPGQPPWSAPVPRVSRSSWRCAIVDPACHAR